MNGLFWANNHVHVVQGKEGICDNKYLKYCFAKTNIESLLVGGGRAKLNANIMMGIDLKVPSFNEQVELGRMFYEIDNLTTLHQHKELKRRNDNNEHLRWSLEVEDYRKRLLIAGLSTRISYNMIDSYRKVINDLNSYTYDEIKNMIMK